MRLLRATLLMITCALVAGGCSEQEYDQSSPNNLLDSLVEMVENGDVGRMPELIYTDDPDLRQCLDSAGIILERIQLLSVTVREKYPDEIDDLLEKGEEEATKRIEEAGNERGRSDWGAQFEGILKDPFGAIEENRDRLTAAYVADDMYALQIDDEPAFGLGLLIVWAADEVEVDENGKSKYIYPGDVPGKWYFQIPMDLPYVKDKLPQTEAEWTIMKSLMKSVANGVRWAEQAVEDEGKYESLDEVWQELAMNVGPNLVVGWVIYEKALENRPEG